MTRPAFVVRDIPVYIPTSAAIGFGLISWFALPAAESVVGEGLASVGLALVLAAAVYTAIFIHELGHALVARRFGYAVDQIVLHLFGGHTLFSQRFKTPWHLGLVSFAGPAANGLVALLAFIAYRATPEGVLNSIFAWLLWSTTVMAIINLLPGTPLDGGSIVQALVWKFSRNEMLARKTAAILGIGVAVLWIFSPFILQSLFGFEINQADVFVSAFVGMWLAGGAWAAYRNANVVGSEHSHEANPVESVFSVDVVGLTRKCIAVDINVSCESALAQAESAGAGAILVTDKGNIVGIVRDAALAAVPQDRRGETRIGSAARQISDGDRLRVDISTTDLLKKMQGLFQQEWLVVDEADRVIGVLNRMDIEKAWHARD